MPERTRTGIDERALSVPGRVLRHPGRIVLSRFLPGRFLLGVAACALAFGTVGGASAAPAPTADQVQKRVVALQEEATVASEKYNETREQLASIKVRVGAAQQRLARQRAEVAAARAEVGRMAAETYRRGELSGLDLVLSGDPQAALAQAGLLPRVGDRQAGVMLRLQEGERQLAADERALAAQQRRLERAELELRLQRNAVNQKLAEAQNLLGQLRAAERAVVLRNTTTAGMAGPGGTVACNGFAAAAPNATAKAVLRFACAQIGDPYVWAAEGPNTWDCSGLTMRAFQQAGIGLPHSSRMQATYGNRVRLAELQPGDLVFFHTPISHVGIYVGAGMMVHAPRTGDVVKVAKMWTTPSAAVRL